MFLEKKKFLDLIGPRFNRAGVRALSFDIEFFLKIFRFNRAGIWPFVDFENFSTFFNMFEHLSKKVSFSFFFS